MAKRGRRRGKAGGSQGGGISVNLLRGRGSQVVFFGQIIFRATLIIFGIWFIAAAIVLVFIEPTPFPDVAFGAVGVLMLSTGILGRSPTISEAFKAGKQITGGKLK